MNLKTFFSFTLLLLLNSFSLVFAQKNETKANDSTTPLHLIKPDYPVPYTGIGFDPAFYYHRPISPFAAHGYEPVMLAGAEMIKLLKSHQFEINDSSVQVLLKK